MVVVKGAPHVDGNGDAAYGYGVENCQVAFCIVVDEIAEVVDNLCNVRHGTKLRLVGV